MAPPRKIPLWETLIYQLRITSPKLLKLFILPTTLPIQHFLQPDCVCFKFAVLNPPFLSFTLPKKAKKSLTHPPPPPPPPPLPHTSVPNDDDLCNICHKEVLDNDPALICDRCNKWAHNKCNKITKKQYNLHVTNPDTPHECINCRKCGTCHKTIAKNGVRSLVRRVVGPKGCWSEGSLVRKYVIPILCNWLME